MCRACRFRAGPGQPHFGQSTLFQLGMAIERIAGNIEADVLGQHHRQLVARHPDRPALIAMDDRDRRAPIALARNAPVAQAILGLALAPAGGFGALDDLGGCLVGRQAVEEVRIDRDAVAGLGLDHRLVGTSQRSSATTRLIGR